MGMSGDRHLSLPSATQDILSTLDNAERLFWADLTLITRRGSVSHVRDAAVSLALIWALQASLVLEEPEKKDLCLLQVC